MDGQNILEIILTARDEASEKIKQVGEAVGEANKNAMDMATAFKAAGGILVGVGVAGAGAMIALADAAAKHQQVMASVDATLKNVSASLQTQTVVIGGSTTATTSSKKAIQEQIQALQLQKQQLTLNNAETTQSVTVTTGHGATLKEHTKIVHQNAAEITAQKNAIDQQIISLKEQELGIAKSGNTQATVTKIVNNANFGYEALVDTTNQVSDAYLRLGFAENDTAPAFAQDLRVTGDIANAKTMLATAADLARLKNIDLSTATTQLTMAYAGNERALKSLGIELPKGTKGMEAISAVEKAAGGQAQAFSHTFEGAMQVLSVNMDKLKETLGDRLLPTLSSFMITIARLIDGLNNLSPATYDTIVRVLEFGTAFALIVGPILLIIGFLPSLVAGFALFSGVALPILGILAAVAAAGYLLYTNWNVLVQLFPQLNSGMNILQSLLYALRVAWGLLQIAGMQFELFFLNHILQIRSALNIGIKAIQDFVNKNRDTFNNFFITVEGLFNFFSAVIGGIWGATWKTMLGVTMGILQVLVGQLQVAWGVIEVIFAIGMGVFTGNWKKAWQDVGKGFTDIWKGIQISLDGILKTMFNGIASFINSIIGAINGVMTGINNAMSKIPGQKKIDLALIPSIPAFEQGGFVPSTGLAMLHAGEFVLSKNMLNGSSPTPQQVSNVTNNKTPITVYATINSDMDLNLLGNKLAFAVRNAR